MKQENKEINMEIAHQIMELFGYEEINTVKDEGLLHEVTSLVEEAFSNGTDSVYSWYKRATEELAIRHRELLEKPKFIAEVLAESPKEKGLIYKLEIIKVNTTPVGTQVVVRDRTS